MDLFHPGLEHVNIRLVETALPPANQRRWIAWGLWAITIALLVAVFVLGTLNGAEVDAEELIFSAIPILAVGTSSTVGALVASRQPANPIGWLFLLFPAGLIIGILAEEYSIYTFHTDPGALPAGEWMGWLGRWTPLSTVVLPLILLLFPTGTPPSPRWRWLPVVLLVGASTVAIVAAMDPRHFTFGVDQGLRVRVDNPIGIRALEGVVEPALLISGMITLLAALACFVGMMSGSAVRGARSASSSAGSRSWDRSPSVCWR